MLRGSDSRTVLQPNEGIMLQTIIGSALFVGGSIFAAYHFVQWLRERGK